HADLEPARRRPLAQRLLHLEPLQHDLQRAGAPLPVTAEPSGPVAVRDILSGVATTPRDLSEAALAFLTERHLATLTTVRPDGSPHVVPVGFTWEASEGLARVITSGTSQKARNAARGGPAVLCQVE